MASRKRFRILLRPVIFSTLLQVLLGLVSWLTVNIDVVVHFTSL